ncbi:phosphatase PAP2 family protein [Pseudopontixanthobacter vadosimaris]|uniref:phosphatase PAP2 family protein n=1 Tax=Pseudopontixanthobacter vadosimaris TaxID=2726450 RepID=UPI001475BD46|nr:phosphatase PAP2 family protein [Pseudopontixanthobacter vadosimaris]
MHDHDHPGDAARPLLRIDRRVRKAVLPYRHTAPVKVLSWFSELGDQPQMRMVAGGVLAFGLWRGEPRLVRAGIRMFVAHETATWAKSLVKHRVIRLRPRSAESDGDQEPRTGHDMSKEKSSFPSGHSAGAIAAARAFSAEFPEYRPLALAAATLVAAAQIPRCAHYPTDVAAGLAIGTFAEMTTAAAWRLLAAGLKKDVLSP